MTRTTKAHLDSLCTVLNELTGIEHRIESAYGGHCLYTDTGNNVFNEGYVSKALLYSLMSAYRRGYILGRGA